MNRSFPDSTSSFYLSLIALNDAIPDHPKSLHSTVVLPKRALPKRSSKRSRSMRVQHYSTGRGPGITDVDQLYHMVWSMISIVAQVSPDGTRDGGFKRLERALKRRLTR